MIWKKLRDRRGFTFIFLAASLLLALCAIAGLALDVSRAYVVKTELQNGADATALAGAGRVYNMTTVPPTINWAQATAEANVFVSKNAAEGKPLQQAQVQTGFWNLNTKTFAPSASTTPPSANHTPAIKVDMEKTPENNGAVQTFFAKVIGWNAFQPAASGVALTGFPGSAPPGTTYPFGISNCLVQDFLNGAGVFTGTDPITNPKTLTFTSTIPTSQGSTIGGLWTNLIDANVDITHTSDNTVQEYINYLIDPAGRKVTPSPPVSAGEYIDLTNGTNNRLYQLTQDLIDRYAPNGVTVYVPIVQCNLSSATPNMQVLGFAEVVLTATDTVAHSITGHFTSIVTAPPGSGPGGVPSNTVIPPLMAQ